MHKIALKLACCVLLLLVGKGDKVVAQTILLDDFESNAIRMVQPSESNPEWRDLWSQYTGDFSAGPDPGVTSITTEAAHTGTRSLKVRVDGGNVYLQFYPHDGVKWHNIREYTQPGSAWKRDTFTRMRFWMKVPQGVTTAGGGNFNLQVGTYERRSTAAQNSAEDGGGHWYHLFDIPYTGAWHQIILDTHPSHGRGASGGTENGDQTYVTGENGYNYFDAMTRFYIDWQGGLPTYPANFYFDGFELYRETQPENMQQIYSLHGVYVPSTNKIFVGWSRNKDENTINHEVRYAFQDIHQIGWDAATPAPNGVVVPPGFQGYNGMAWDTNAINVSGQSVIYIAMKPANASLFRQIAIPIAGSPPATALVPPTNLRIVQ